MILILILGCAPGSLAVPASVGQLSLDHDSLALGPAAMDEVASGTLTLRNDGDAALSVTGAVTGDGFTLDGGASSASWTLAPGASRRVALSYAPPDVDPRDGALTLTPDPTQLFADDRGAQTVPLSGSADPDADDDGHDSPLADGDDCDDHDASVYPGADEVWYDGVDQGCDGHDDDDQDGDGWDRRDDCDDTDAGTHPGASDDSLDGVDQDCDDLVDDEAIAALAGSVILTEFLASSAVVPGEDGQWLELAAVGDQTLDISTWRLGDAATAGTLDGPDSLAPGEILLVCAEANPALNGGLSCDATLSPWPDLSGGEISLLAPIFSARGVERDRVTIDKIDIDSDWPAATGRSTQLDAHFWSAVANDAASFWCLSAAVDGADGGTPGEDNGRC